MRFGEEYSKWGSLYPRVNIEGVIFKVPDYEIVVSAQGDLPLYKSHTFEQSVKRWFVSQLSTRETYFKNTLQDMEKNFWSHIPFQKALYGKVNFNSSLSDSLSHKGDYIIASFLNEIGNADYS
jgi:hypothetical protein